MTTLVRATICLVLAALTGCGNSQPPTETVNAPSGLDSFTDTATGCEYLGRYKFGLVPRIAADGHSHMGCKGSQP
jgi:hypothetical protein